MNVAVEATRTTGVNIITNKTQEIKNALGVFQLNLSESLNFEHGLIGLSAYRNFCLLPIITEKPTPLMLLQSTQHHQVHFVVLPSLPHSNKLISAANLNQAYTELKMTSGQLLMLFIVNKNKNQALTINAKAPILINKTTRQAYQYVFENADYDIQHEIS